MLTPLDPIADVVTRYKGVVNLVEIMSGSLKRGDRIHIASTDMNYDVVEVGVNNPGPVPVTVLSPGQVGYLVTGMKSAAEARVGDTVSHLASPVEALPGFQPARCMVFAGV